MKLGNIWNALAHFPRKPKCPICGSTAEVIEGKLFCLNCCSTLKEKETNEPNRN